MQESFNIRFARGESALPVSLTLSGRHDRRGIVLGPETSAWPRGFALDFYQESPSRSTRRSTGTRTGQRKRQKYNLDITTDGKELRCRAATVLPTGEGDYFVRVRVGGIEFETTRKAVPLRRRAPPTIQFVERAPTKALRLSRPVGEFHQRMLDILDNSRLDRQRATAWIQSAVNRDRRRACVLNILAKLATLTGAGTPLLNHVRRIFLADSDRIYISAAPALLTGVQACDAMVSDGHIHETHQRLVKRLPRAARASDYSLQGFRETENPSLQIVLARPQNSVAGIRLPRRRPGRSGADVATGWSATT